MLRKLFNGGKQSGDIPDVRELYDAAYFDGRVTYPNPDTVQGFLGNLHVQGEVTRLDTNERLDTLIEVQRELLATQRELLATQKAILEALQRPERS